MAHSERSPIRPARRVLVSAVRVGAELSITVGVVLALFIGYQLVGTGWATARSQQAAATELENSWTAAPQARQAAPAVGIPIVRLHVPRFAPDWNRVVLGGTDAAVLARGPGHYTGTALPGETGNVAIAGHRVSNGAPFDATDRLRSCDAIVLETRDRWWVYRVLPMAAEVTDWSAIAAGRAECGEVRPLDGSYGDTVGRKIVTPDQVEAIAPVPYHPEAAPTRSLLTLTTCHPRFSARERMIIHALLVDVRVKDGSTPSELGGG